MQSNNSEGSCLSFAGWQAYKKDFSTSKVVPVPVLAVWRLLAGVYCLVWWIYNLIWYPNATFFIYLTHWTFTVSTAFFLFGAFLSITTFVKQLRNQAPEQSTQLLYERLEDTEADHEPGEDNEELHHDIALAWYHKTYWIMFYIAGNVSPTITVFYITYLQARENPENQGPINDLTKHLFVTIFLLLETAINGMPVFFSHLIFPLIFTGTYMAFTVIFWLAEGVNHRGKKQIYEGIEYGSTPGVKVVFGMFLFACGQLIIQLILLAVYKLRQKFCEKFSSN